MLAIAVLTAGSGCRRRPSGRKATSLAALSRAVSGPRAVREPVHALSLQAREPGGPAVARLVVMVRRAARGRPRPQARDERPWEVLSLIHISEPTRLGMISYAVFCLKKKKKKTQKSNT